MLKTFEQNIYLGLYDMKILNTTLSGSLTQMFRTLSLLAKLLQVRKQIVS